MGLYAAMRALFAFHSRERRTTRALRRAPLRPIQRVPHNSIVKISGRLRYLHPPILAPLSGRACAWYTVAVEELGQLVIHDEDGCDFLLEDGSARAVVRARTHGAQVALVKDACFRAGSFADVDRELVAFLRWHGRHQHRFLGVREPLSFKEGVLEEGEAVTACGVAHWEVDPDPHAWAVGYREFPRRLVLKPLPDGKLHISDDPATLLPP